MANSAVISGTYADLKFVKTRGVIQIVVEVPIEQGRRVVDVFGTPLPGHEVPVALARLLEKTEPPPGTPETKARRSFRDLPRSQQAGIACSDPRFRAWTKAQGAFDHDPSEEEAARWVRSLCGIGSRVELNSDDQAAARWDQTFMDYLSDTHQIPEMR